MNWRLDRKTREVATLALVSLVAVGSLRYPLESTSCFIAEMILLAVLFAASVLLRGKSEIRFVGIPIGNICSAILIATPILASLVCRRCGLFIAFEMTALTVLGSMALAMSIWQQRLQALSIVLSGFLTLFATVISDWPLTVGIAIAWIMLCVWHLVANHWDRIELHCVGEVTRHGGLRPMTVLIAVGLFGIGGLIAKDRFGESNRFTMGFMPSSGGSKWSDPSAIKGIGTGDAAIAAVNHADSFGAVDSEMFLETTESTLFDMFSDSIGQPKRRAVWERRQGMNSEEVQEAHGRTSKSEKGGGTFSTDRLPTEKHPHLQDSIGKAVVQWSGRTGIRLAMNRYDTFDGIDWSNEASHRQENFLRRQFDDQVWFADPKVARQVWGSSASSARHELLKVIKLDSTRLPVPMLAAGVHIKDIDRPDFFGIDDDGSFFMPGREKVPPLTVVHVVSQSIMEDELIDELPSNASSLAIADSESSPQLQRIVEAWTAGKSSKYEKLRAVINHLREDFHFDRGAEIDSGRPLDQFLKQRRGGDHLFATTAALMARHIGLPSRLVTGFYVRPAAFDVSASHTDVLASDVHVWVEIAMQDGRWFEVEPTPGFRQPMYQPSWWLASRRFALQYWPVAAIAAALITLLVLTRLIWTDWIVGLVWWASAPLDPKRRLGLAMRIIEFRATMLRQGRPATLLQREWILDRLLPRVDQELAQRAAAVCDMADRLCFGSSASDIVPHKEHRDRQRDERRLLNAFVSDLPMRTLKGYLKEHC